jgi:hypothetical protein
VLYVLLVLKRFEQRNVNNNLIIFYMYAAYWINFFKTIILNFKPIPLIPQIKYENLNSKVQFKNCI